MFWRQCKESRPNTLRQIHFFYGVSGQYTGTCYCRAIFVRRFLRHHKIIAHQYTPSCALPPLGRRHLNELGRPFHVGLSACAQDRLEGRRMVAVNYIGLLDERRVSCDQTAD
jgi:hypothetical protein